VKTVNTELSEKRRVAGLKGGQAVKEKYGPSYYHFIGIQGGRPGLPAIEQLLSQQAALRQEELKIRRSRLPGGNSVRALKARVLLKIETGELLCCCGHRGSPEGVKQVC